MTGNVFRTLNGNIDRIEGVNTTFADLNYGTMRNVTISGNTFNGITTPCYNPVTITHTEASDNGSWTVDFNDHLPFQGRTRTVESVVPISQILSGSTRIHGLPYVSLGQGTNGDQVKVNWQNSCRGSISITARMDKPT